MKCFKCRMSYDKAGITRCRNNDVSCALSSCLYKDNCSYCQDRQACRKEVDEFSDKK